MGTEMVGKSHKPNFLAFQNQSCLGFEAKFVIFKTEKVGAYNLIGIKQY